MRIHSNTLTLSDVQAAVRAAGAVAVNLTEHRSKSHARAFNVKLEGSSRRRPNGGQSGAGTGYAATWDQWGIFLASLYVTDPNMVTPYYSDADDFATRTADRFGAPEVTMTAEGYREVFVTAVPEDAHGDHTFRFSGVPYQQSCTKCSATQRWS